MISLQEVNEKYLDVLTEIGNIGAGNATTAIADMLGLRIDPSGGGDWHFHWCGR